jgi:hypothetical protein
LKSRIGTRVGVGVTEIAEAQHVGVVEDEATSAVDGDIEKEGEGDEVTSAVDEDFKEDEATGVVDEDIEEDKDRDEV